MSGKKKSTSTNNGVVAVAEQLTTTTEKQNEAGSETNTEVKDFTRDTTPKVMLENVAMRNAINALPSPFPTQPLRPPTRGEKTTLVRKLIADFPEETNQQIAARVQPAAALLGIEMLTSSSGNEVSSIRAKLREEQGLPPLNTGRRSGGKNSLLAEPGMTELLKVRDFIKQEVSLEAAIDVVEKFSTEIGSFERLKLCIDTLKKLKME